MEKEYKVTFANSEEETTRRRDRAAAIRKQNDESNRQASGPYKRGGARPAKN